MSKDNTSLGSAATGSLPQQRARTRSGIWNSDVLRRFRRHRMAQIGAVIIILMAFAALGAPWIAPYGAEQITPQGALSGPSSGSFFGTDQIGRDIFSRIIHGARYSMTIGFVAVAVGLVIGLPVGMTSGYRGGWVDIVIMRIVDVLFAFPSILLALMVIAIFGTGLFNAMVAIGIAQMPIYSRLMRGMVLQVRGLDYVDAARAAGAPESRILTRHVLPNTLSPLIVQSTLQLAAAILSAAYLGFLGLGAPPGTPEWGTMLSEARNYLTVAAHVTIFPGVTIMVVVLAVNLVGDGLRDALEPRLQQHN